MKKIIFLCLVTFMFTGELFAQNPPGLNLIRIEDLKNDLYALSDAHFKGRSAGTLDELKAAQWLAEKYRAIGIKPAGDDGTYLQYFTLWRNHVADNTGIQLNKVNLKLWKDVAISQMANASIHSTVIYLGNALDIDTNTVDVKDKVVAIEANPKGINLNITLPTWRYNRYIYLKYGLPLVKRGAKAIIFIADAVAENAWDDAEENFKRGNYDIEGGMNENVTATVPVIWLHAGAKKELKGDTATIDANIIVDKYPYPSVNVVGMIKGTDPKLKAEYVLYSGHIDGHGIRNVIGNDSVYHGADDNGSADVALLALGRAFIKNPPKRSILFIINGAEERGLLGSKYFSAHPTVPINAIAAVLNADMIGRNNIDSAAILGMLSPHKNSTDLVNMVLAANNEGPKFILDTAWDNPAHIEVWYYRSDHLPYARLGIPALMFSTLPHADYHTPQDNAENVNYFKLKKMTDWMYRAGWKVANVAKRPATDKNFHLER